MDSITAIMSMQVTPTMLFSGITVVSAIALVGILWHDHRRKKKAQLEKWLK